MQPGFRSVLFALTVATGFASSTPAGAPVPSAELWREVEVIRTAHGVPHIRAENLRAAGYALAWVMSEDYGPRTGMRLLLARGELARFEGRARLDADFENRRSRARAIETYHLLDPDDANSKTASRPASTAGYAAPATFPPAFHQLQGTTSHPDIGTAPSGQGPPLSRRVRGVTAPGVDPRRHTRYSAVTTQGSNAWALAQEDESGRRLPCATALA